MTAAGPRALRSLRHPRLWLGLWLLLIALLAAGSLLPASGLPREWFPGFDKLQHFLGYALLSAYAVMLFERMRAQALAALGLLMVGIALEVAQSQLTQTRTGSIGDVAANAAGVLAGLPLGSTRLARALQRLDARLSRGRS